MNAVISAYKAIAKRALEQASYNTSIIVFHDNAQYIWARNPKIADARDLMLRYITTLCDIEKCDVQEYCCICNQNNVTYSTICKLDREYINYICSYCKCVVDTLGGRVDKFTVIDDVISDSSDMTSAIWTDAYNAGVIRMATMDEEGSIAYYDVFTTYVIVPQISSNVDWLPHEGRFRTFLTIRAICQLNGAPHDIFELIVKRVLDKYNKHITLHHNNRRLILQTIDMEDIPDDAWD